MPRHVPSDFSWNAVIVCIWFCAATADAWSCNLTLQGSEQAQQQQLALDEVSLSCTPAISERSSVLSVSAHPALSNGSFTGVQVEPVPEAIASSLMYFDQVNITFEEVLLQDINAVNLSQIIDFEQSNITVNSLHSSGCIVQYQIIQIGNCSSSDQQQVANINNAVFEAGQGRAFWICNSNISIFNTAFDNLSSSDGGAVKINNTEGSSVQISGCTFTNNYVTTGNGGALYIQSLYSHVYNSTFSNNTARWNGGALLIDQGTQQATVEACTFSRNSCSLRGAHLYMFGSSTDTLQLLDSSFEDSPGDLKGLNMWGVGNVYVSGCRFQRSNYMYVYGYPERVSNLFILNSVFLDNSGGYNISDESSDRKGDINDAGECSGVLCSSCQCVGVYNSTFINNTGAGICIRSSQGNCETSQAQTYPPLFNRSTIAGVSGSQWIINNTNADLASVSLDIRASTFVNNVAPGVIRAATDESLLQAAVQSGGAINMVDVHRSILADNVFHSNQGEQGGAIHMDSCSVPILWNITFIDNTAMHEGGALSFIENQHTDGMFMGAITARNNSARSGGALYADAGAGLTITNGSVFEYNSAVAVGGALHCVSCQQTTVQLDVDMGFNMAQDSGGAIYLDNCDSFTATSLQLHNNGAGDGGALYVSAGTSTTLVNISASSFTSNAANLSYSGGGGAIYVDGGVLFSYNNTMASNTASAFGGALAYQHQCINTSQVPDGKPDNQYVFKALGLPLNSLCSFVNSTHDILAGNTAVAAGGAIFATDNSSLNISCSDQAAADPVYGCSGWSGNEIISLPVLALDRLVGYGGVIAYLPAVMQLTGPQSINYTSDGQTPLELRASIFDMAGVQVTRGVTANGHRQDLTALASVVPVGLVPPGIPEPELLGASGSLDFNDANISLPNLLLLAHAGIYNLSLDLVGFPMVMPAWKLVTVRPCGIGQVQQNNQTCFTCPPATYSFDPTHPACEACPSTDAVCNGGSGLIPDLQSWHSHPYSDYIIGCPNGKACQGSRDNLLACKNSTYAPDPDILGTAVCDLQAGVSSSSPTSYMAQQCTTGYYGPVCSLCVKNAHRSPDQRSYGRVGTLQCKPCRKAGTIVIAYIGSTCLVLVWLLYTIEVNLRENEEDAEGGPRPPRVSELLKAVTLWLQYMTLLAGVNIPAPGSLHWVFSAANFAFTSVTSGALSTDCLLSGHVTAALQRILVHLAVPVLLLALLSIMQLCWWAAKAHNEPTPTSAAFQASEGLPASPFDYPAWTRWQGRLPELKRRMLITLLCVAFYYYPSLLTTVLSLFSCFHIDPATPGPTQHYPRFARETWHLGYWIPDMRVPCFTGWHLKLCAGMGAPLLLLVCISIPLLPVLLLLRHCKQLQTPVIQLRLGFIYTSYRPRFWFWDSVILAQTLAIAAAQVFGSTETTQLIIMLILMMIGVIALAHNRPFQERLPQSTQVFGLFTVMATGMGCLFFVNTDSAAKGPGLSALGVLLMLLNVVYIGVMVVLVLVQGARHVRRYARKAKLIWQRALCWLIGLCGSPSEKPAEADRQVQRQIDMTSAAVDSDVKMWRFERMLSRRLSSLSLELAEPSTHGASQ